MAMIPAVGIKFGFANDDGPKFFFKSYADADAFINTVDVFVNGPTGWIYLAEFPEAMPADEDEVFDNPYHAVFLNLEWVVTAQLYSKNYLRGYKPKIYHNLMELCSAVKDAKDPKCTIMRTIKNGDLMHKVTSVEDYNLRHKIADNMLTYILMMESMANFNKYDNLLKQYDSIPK